MATALTVLAIIGKILLVILAVLLLIILLVLFVPIRYAESGAYRDGTLHSDTRASWLFHFLSATVHVTKEKDKEKVITFEWKILGINLKAWRKKRKEKRQARAKAQKKKRLETIRKKDPERFEELKEKARQRKAERAALAEQQRAERQASLEEAARRRERERQELKAEKDPRRRTAIRVRQQLGAADRFIRVAVKVVHRVFWLGIDAIICLSGLPARATELIAAIASKIASVISGIASALSKMVSKIAQLCATILRWKNFWEDERVVRARRILMKRSLRILKHIRPRRISGELTFGFEDQALTGQVLAAASALYPLYGGKVYINPDFSGRIFACDLSLEGRVQLFVPAFELLMLVLNKDVRYAYRTFKALRAETRGMAEDTAAAAVAMENTENRKEAS